MQTRSCRSADEPNVRADTHQISDGVAVKSVNWLGSLDRDFYAVHGLLLALPAGRLLLQDVLPSASARGAISRSRSVRMAGLGHLEPKAHHKYYDKEYLFADVVVVGAGPAGLEAAIASAEAGAETLLIDEWPEVGGSLLYGRGGVDRARANFGARRAPGQGSALPSLRILTGTTVSGLFPIIGCRRSRRGGCYKIRSKETVLATGTFDQPLVFPDNDRPGIMFVGRGAAPDAALRRQAGQARCRRHVQSLRL